MSERYTVSYTTGAKEDLRSIYSYVAFKLKERQVAKRLVERIRKEIRALNTFPERFQSVEWEPWASMGMRQLVVGNYIIYYLADISLKQVAVSRVVYGVRNIESMIRDE